MGISCLTEAQNVNQGYILKPQSRPHFTHFGAPDVVTSHHFTSKNIQCWALEQGIQWNFHCPHRSQALGFIEHYYGICSKSKFN